MRQDYTVGFAFSADRTKIVLIRKNRPAWQAGKMNGAGGKVEAGETFVACMIREFFEECGVQTETSDWHYFSKVIGKDGDVHFYSMFDDKCLAAKTMLDEEVIVMDVSLDEIRKTGMANLAWLIGIALDETQPIFFVEANYNQEFKTGKTGTDQ